MTSLAHFAAQLPGKVLGSFWSLVTFFHDPERVSTWYEDLCVTTGGDEASVLAMLSTPSQVEDTDLLTRDSDGATPLHCAVELGHDRALRILLTHPDADPDVQDKLGNTPLHMASAAGHEACARALLEAKADPTLKNKEGYTAADMAYSDTIREMLTGKRIQNFL